jgi:hypothetical protein
MLAIISQWVQLVMKYAGGLIALPIAARQLATGEFNLWLLFNTMGGFVLMFDLGLYPSLLRLNAAARNEDAGVRELNNGVTKKVYDQLSGWAMLALPVVAGIYAYPLIVKTGNAATSYVGLLFMSAALSMKLRNKYFEIVYIVNERIPALRMIESFVLVIQIVLQVAALYWVRSVLLLCIIELAATMAIYMINRRLCDFASHVPVQDLFKHVALIKEASKNGVGTVISIVLLMYVNWLIGLKCSPAYVAAYLVYLKVFDAVAMVCQTPFYVKLPRLIANIEDKELTLKSANANIKAVIGLMLVALLSVSVASPLLNKVFHLTDDDATYFTLKLLAVYALTRRIGAMYMQMHNATGDIATHKVELLNAATVVGLSFAVLALKKTAWLAAVLPLGYFLGYLLYATILWSAYVKHRKLRIDIAMDYLISLCGVAVLWTL